MRLINADFLKADVLKICTTCKDNGGEYCRKYCLINTITSIIDNTPTVEPERPHGKWQVKDKLREGFYICSNCGEISCCKGNFCTDCGAQMSEEVQK